jgi:hypothetical protein
MKTAFAIILGLLTLVLSGLAPAQDKGEAVVVDTVETVVTVVEVDREKRVVIVRGPAGNLTEVAVPPEAQNLDQVQPGSRFRVKYLESVAVKVRKGGAASSSAGRTMKLAPKGDTPGGVIVNMLQVAGVVETIDYGTRVVSVRGPEGRLLIFTVADEVQGLEKVQVGDTISVEYTESLAMRMIKE